MVKNYNKKKTHSSSSKPRTAQMMIFSLVVMTGLEKCCIRSAYLQGLFHSDERAMAYGCLVYLYLIRLFKNSTVFFSEFWEVVLQNWKRN